MIYEMNSLVLDVVLVLLLKLMYVILVPLLKCLVIVIVEAALQKGIFLDEWKITFPQVRGFSHLFCWKKSNLKKVDEHKQAF